MGPACARAGEACDPKAARCCTGTVCSKLATGGTYCVNTLIE
jgi:hypothetical protein